MALCLREERRDDVIYFFRTIAAALWRVHLPSCDRGCHRHPSQSDLTSCLWTSRLGWHLRSPGLYPWKPGVEDGSLAFFFSSSGWQWGCKVWVDLRLVGFWSSARSLLPRQSIARGETSWLWFDPKALRAGWMDGWMEVSPCAILSEATSSSWGDIPHRYPVWSGLQDCHLPCYSLPAGPQPPPSLWSSMCSTSLHTVRWYKLRHII